MSGPDRYMVPSPVMLAVAARLAQAFETLRLLALAAKADEGGETIEVLLRFMHTRLDDIHESLLAVISEQPGEREHGSDRPC